jgi:hypothetical protein
MNVFGMKINVATLPAQGLPLDITIAKESLNERLATDSSTSLRLATDIQFQGKAIPNPGGAELAGTIRAEIEQECGRCVDNIIRVETLPFSIILKRVSGRLPEEDIGISYFIGDHVIIDSLIVEALALELSPFWRGPADEEGRCLLCRRTFEDILKERNGA